MNPLPPRSSIAPAKPLGHFWHLFGTMAFGAPHARFRTARAAFRAAALARTTLGAAFESATLTFPKFVRRLRLAGHLQALASRTSCLSPDADCLTRNVSRPPWRSAALSTSIDELRWRAPALTSLAASSMPSATELLQFAPVFRARRRFFRSAIDYDIDNDRRVIAARYPFRS